MGANEIVSARPVGEVAYVDEDGNLVWTDPTHSPTEDRLTALEAQVQALQLSIDNLTAYVKSTMTVDQRLRCAVPHEGR